jgi:hypothetical protein
MNCPGAVLAREIYRCPDVNLYHIANGTSAVLCGNVNNVSILLVSVVNQSINQTKKQLFSSVGGHLQYREIS